jgi:ribonuclease T
VRGPPPDRLRTTARPPAEALADFVTWVEEVAVGTRPVLVALNAPFDWMFVADALQRHVGRNPFGHSALDMKALFMGVAGVPWAATSLRHMAVRYDLDVTLPHHALEDAVVQARVFRAILEELAARTARGARPGPGGDHDGQGSAGSRSTGEEHDRG